MTIEGKCKICNLSYGRIGGYLWHCDEAGDYLLVTDHSPLSERTKKQKETQRRNERKLKEREEEINYEGN